MLSQELYGHIRRDQGFQFQLEHKGLLMLCQTEKLLEEEIKGVELQLKSGEYFERF